MRAPLIAVALCACGDNLPLRPPTGPIARYVVHEQQLPLTVNAARQYGVDLTGDRITDNQLAQAFGLMATQRVDPFADAAALVERGDVVMLAQLQTAAPTDPVDSVAMTIFGGSDPDPAPCADDQDDVCGRHLQGDARFAVQQAGDYLLGWRGPSPHILGTGDMPIAFGFFGTPVELTLIDGRVRLDQLDDTGLAGSLGGWLDRAELEAELVPIFATMLQRSIASECTMPRTPPGCGCPATEGYGYGSREWLDLFDYQPRDCSISIDEVVTNSLVQTLLAPDGPVGGMVSFGLGIAAVPARFEP